MNDVNQLLKTRLNSKKKEHKAGELAKQSASGYLSSFSGVFKTTPLTQEERLHLEAILKQYQKKETDLALDLEKLFLLTSELKAINNQAIILHGERIKKAQDLLKEYKEGAFSSWLIAIYGNRQTPYNFLQYYEFYSSLPKDLQEKIFSMPRQAIYTLASRKGNIKDKEKIIQKYNGESKNILLDCIRKTFPLQLSDKRYKDLSTTAISSLTTLTTRLQNGLFSPSKKQKTAILQLLHQLLQLTKQDKTHNNIAS